MKNLKLLKWKYNLGAFTLAEVLITLGIIGIVAAMTMPSLIQSHKKKVAEIRLKYFASLMSQISKHRYADELAKNSAAYCTSLIYYDGWSIENDNPCWK